MPKYNVVIRNNQGASKKVMLSGPSEEVVSDSVKKQGFSVASIHRIEDASGGKSAAKNKGLNFNIDLFEKPIKMLDIKNFTIQFSVLLSAGISLLRALTILSSDCSHPKLKKCLEDIADKVSKGSTFYNALSKYEKEFGSTYIAMVKAGEVSGQLDKILVSLATYIEKKDKVKQKVKKAMMYPILALTFALTICTGLLVFVVPRFVKIFQDQGQELPGPTKAVMAISQYITGQWYVIIGVVVAIAAAFIALNKNPSTKIMLEKIYLKIPMFGTMIKKASVERLSRIWALLTEANLEILESFKIIQEVMDYKLYKNAIKDVSESLSKGKTISFVLAKYDIFPDLLKQLVQVGEETGKMEAVLNKVADFYEEELDNEIEGLLSLIEPALIMVLGVLVGGIVIALYLPVFSMAGGVG